MTALLQRVSSAPVTVTGQVVGETGAGLLILIGLANDGPLTIWIDSASPQTLSSPIN